MQQFYWRSAEEIDAFACGDAAREKIRAVIGHYEENKDKARTDPAFGTTHHARRGLPITAAQWKTNTARNLLHFRSADLTALDKALAAYEGAPTPQNFTALRQAFATWSRNNPKEATTRNVDLCVTHLREFVEAA